LALRGRLRVIRKDGTRGERGNHLPKRRASKKSGGESFLVKKTT